METLTADIFDALVNNGDEVKALDGAPAGVGKIGGYLVRYGSQDQPDVKGDWFTPQTYLGRNEGNGADTMIHHGMPLRDRFGNPIPGLEWTRDVLLPAVKTKRDKVGLFCETVLDLSDEFQGAVYDLVEGGKLRWSSGAATHTVRRRGGASVKAGEILRWPIIEASLTPTPVEPRGTQVEAIKALDGLYREDILSDLQELAVKALDYRPPTPADVIALNHLGAGLLEGLRFGDHTERVHAACEEFSRRFHDLVEDRDGSRKAQWAFNSDNYQRLSALADALCETGEDLVRELGRHRPADIGTAAPGVLDPVANQVLSQALATLVRTA